MQEQQNWPVIIVGAGLAGLTSAIHLSKMGIKVLLIEKENLPAHKVCGEYVSNEVLPYLDSLGFDPFAVGATRINRLEVVLASGKTIKTNMQLGGFGLSRYHFDYSLLQLAKSYGTTAIKAQVQQILFKDTVFTVNTQDGKTFKAAQVIAAYGKRSVLDKNLERPFFKQSAPFLAVKTHRKGDFPSDLVGLYNFKGGYCGISCVEQNIINSCYIATYKSFKKHKNPEQFEQEVLSQNPVLKQILEVTEPIFEKPLTISQISFLNKPAVQKHILFAGDAAGLIHPLCGNGMSMAIESAQLASELIIKFLKGQIRRAELESSYKKQWNQKFKKRLNTGHYASKIMQDSRFSSVAFKGLKTAPFILDALIKRTHGQILKPLAL
ncbi:MAG: NAD(P)/FAD-dependent oxidoreductase [Gilvibacter sp.]